MNACSFCGRPDVCGPCLEGNPPETKVEADRVARARADKRRRERADQVERYLSDLPDLYALLALFRLPGVGASDDDRRPSGGNPSRPPVNLAVLDLTDERDKPGADPTRTDYDIDRRAGARRQGVTQTLASWSRLVDEERRIDDLPSDLADDPTVASECSYLLTHLVWSAEQQWFDELADDVEQIRSDIRAAVHDRDPDPLQCTDPQCSWPVEAMGENTWFRCTGCGRTWTQAEVSKLYARQQPMPLAELADVLGRPVKTLHRWVANRWLRSCGRDHRGRLYDCAQAQEVAASVIPGVRRDEAQLSG